MIGVVRLYCQRPAGIGRKTEEHAVMDYPRAEGTQKARELRRDGWLIYHTEIV